MVSVATFGMAALMILFLFVVSKLLQVLWVVFLWPHSLTRRFKKQGIVGPPYKPVSGSLDEIKRMKKAAAKTILDLDSNDIVQRVLPHFHRWSSEYGETFLYWQGLEPNLCISDPEMAKQILSNKFGFYVKPRMRPTLLTIIGRGLVFVEGLDWVRHRRIINPAFSVDKLKVMVKRMVACTSPMLEEWKDQSIRARDRCTKKEMNGEFQRLAADIIAHTAFGSNFMEGKEVFQAQRQLQQWGAASSSDIFIPGSQYLPTPSNLRIWKLDMKMKRLLRQIVESRLQNSRTFNGSSPECCFGDDLLGVMIAALETTKDKGDLKLNMNEIVDECKTFFFAGHETTSNLLTWTMFLLSKHHEWQTKLREEVLEECGTETPDTDMLAKLKLVHMVLLEALRLYGPVIAMVREASEDMTLENLMIPKRTLLVIPLIKMHRSKECWGEDASEFNPLRFMNGISKAAKHPNALLAFSIGPRACIGQNFAMLEAKTVLALILQRFSFSVSPEYKHTPVDNLTLQPQHGLPVIFKPLCL
ncbi:hypothetical protein SLE2022_241140 [Rubroshorea leprosula]